LLNSGINDQVPSHLNQDRFYAILVIPVCQDGDSGRVHLAIRLVDEGNINLGNKSNDWWFIRIIFSTFYLQAVNSILVDGLTSSI
jgi:hypothetical protein